MTATLDDISARRLAGEPLTDTDAETLAASHDIVTLGMLADEVRRARHGRTTTYVRVADVPLPPSSGDVASWPESARELRVSDSFPGIDAAIASLARLVAASGGVPVTAFSLQELERMAGSPEQLRAWLTALREAGLAAVAEASLDGLVVPAAALDAAAGARLPVARLVVDRPIDGGPLGLVRRVGSLGGALDAALALAPLARHPAAEPTTGYADVKAMALARILLRVPHLQVDWALHGPKLAQVALTFGADDVDNVSARNETGEGPRRAPLEEIRRNIRAASLEPVERDGRFEVAG